ncbi:MAG: ATP-binding cassette domain-containing protein [Sphingobacteriales bacterium]|nr:MAG: ATP-binding cassette domain-containing protein [Sphingobacteriales bacterium]TAF79466.1 MAG: ATP-binding cassette domain-containing protein [Sphingobacteriales bacterium]
MEICLQNIGRRFNREWIFRTINYTFRQDKKYAILGKNGSGKSTLLKVISGCLSPSEGEIIYTLDNQIIAAENYYLHLTLAAPYLELMEEFSLNEVLDFHFKFKKRAQNIDNQDVVSLLGMQKNQHKAIKYFSSGMKQRVKLALAFCTETPILLLDEPTSNLDTEGLQWYLNMVQKFSHNRLTIVCSNQPAEYQFCDAQLNVSQYII